MRPTFMLFLLLFPLMVIATECEFAYQQATYGYQHAEKAMEANNTDHLELYAARSKEALQKVFNATKECGCIDANNASYDALEYLNKSQSAEKYEIIRHFVDKARTSAKEILIALDVCSVNQPSYALAQQETNLLMQEEQLKEQQRLLAEKQQKLQEAMEQQKKLQQAIQEQKEAMFTSQLQLKADMEPALKQLKLQIDQIIVSLNCPQRNAPMVSGFTRTENELKQETLEETRKFYVDKAIEMANLLQNFLIKCK